MNVRKNAEGITIIRAEKGKWLVKGESYSNTDVYLGTHDKPENWTEVDAPPEEATPESIVTELENLI